MQRDRGLLTSNRPNNFRTPRNQRLPANETPFHTISSRRGDGRRGARAPRRQREET